MITGRNCRLRPIFPFSDYCQGQACFDTAQFWSKQFDSASSDGQYCTLTIGKTLLRHRCSVGKLRLERRLRRETPWSIGGDRPRMNTQNLINDSIKEASAE